MTWFLLIVFGVILGITGDGWWFAILMCVGAFVDVAWARPSFEEDRGR
ncbi:MAG TPA: hypothetical protein VKZ66_03890 [Pusillimonas sp.]|nr:MULTISPECIES: hypothetical protein [unclassified Pusillimonas]HLU19078.1 hypothetical protein [Pusillimonas sp.]